MKPKNMIISSAVALSIALGGGIWSNDRSANALEIPAPINTKERTADMTTSSETEDLTDLLGASTDEIYNDLYNGNSLAEIARKNHADVTKVIDLQIAELAGQLDSRLASGQLSPAQYEAQKSELADIITKSVYGEQNRSI
jgi:hypothetical protein